MLLTAADLVSNPSLLDTGATFRLAGGGHFWCDAERVGRLVRLTRVAHTEGGPKVLQYFVNPRQLVTITRPVAHG
jgi:hypothetical protein